MTTRMRNSKDREVGEVFQVLNRMRAEAWQRWRARWMCDVTFDGVATETNGSSNLEIARDHNLMRGDRQIVYPMLSGLPLRPGWQ